MQQPQKTEEGGFWFSEKSVMWPGISQSLEIEKVLLTRQTKYQNLQVLQTKTFGRMLTLDGVIQVTERDEFSYQEIMSHLALYSHPHPRRVLIIGGGDGGVQREVAKHSCVEHIDLCDIDEGVTEASRQFLPGLSCSLDDPRLTLRFEDGAAFVKSVAESGREDLKYDVVITDSSDPVGPAEVLYQAEYYGNLRRALRKGGVVCSQAESMWLHGDVIKRLFKTCGTAGFGCVEYAYVMIPTYPCGSIGALLCREDPNSTSKVPVRKMTQKEESSMKYYTHEIHSAAFVLPAFMKDVVGKN